MRINEIRIQKVLSEAGVASRRKSEQMINEGRVKVNGHPATIGMKINPRKDLVIVDGNKIDISTKIKKQYIAVYKPRGYVTTMKDEFGRKDVSQLVTKVGTKIYPIGRLDQHSEGLLIMTNDGDFANKLMHPRHKIMKTYRVTTSETVTNEQIAQLAEGIVIEGKKTLPAEVKILVEEDNRTVLQIGIKEGRNRQIRKMFEAIGADVKRLKRTQIGIVRLGMLKPKEYRNLTKVELEYFQNMIENNNSK